MKKCPKCNRDLPDEAMFCVSCGTDLKEIKMEKSSPSSSLKISMSKSAPAFTKPTETKTSALKLRTAKYDLSAGTIPPSMATPMHKPMPAAVESVVDSHASVGYAREDVIVSIPAKEKNVKKIVVIIVVILSMIVSAVGGWFVYKWIADDGDKTSKTNSTQSQEANPQNGGNNIPSPESDDATKEKSEDDADTSGEDEDKEDSEDGFSFPFGIGDDNDKENASQENVVKS